MPYSLHKILAPVQPSKAGPINAVLFFDDGTRLATGGDDQILRIWDVRSGDCQQELRDPHWGQITNLSLMLNAGGRTQGMIVGTGRGIVSIYPWHDLTQQFNRQAVTTTTVFTDVPVERQALDCANSRLAVASHLGTINMYAIQNHKHLNLTWTFSIGASIPRSLEFVGDSNETLTIHTLTTGNIFSCDSMTGKSTGESRRLRGGVGFVAFSPNKQQKAVHNLNTDRYDLYDPTHSTTPICVSLSGTSRKVKGASFGEGVQILVCGGDKGTLNIYNMSNRNIEQELTQRDFGTVCAVTTCTTRDYHLVASGAGESPALVYIWGKPTERRLAEDMEQERDREQSAARAASEAAALASTIEEAELHRAEVAAQDAIVQNLRDEVDRIRTQKFYCAR
ncbi:WD40-repeat-containing domain protein [Mycena leptocephala]|nr:WD40-repeat-containing domain protein [Mycena leptocephala]